MARSHLAALFLVAALAVASGTRVPLQAAAPAPAPAAPVDGADVLFLMEAQQATFTDAQTLTLSGLTGSAQSFAVGGRTAVYPIAAFTGPQFVDASGQWLGNPQAVFYGVNPQGNMTTVVLSLSSPKYSTPPAGTITNNNNNNNNGGTITNNNDNGQTLSFTVAAVADASKVKLPGGAVSQKLAEAAAGAGDSLVTTLTPGARFTNAILFIDSNQKAVGKTAETKWGWGGWFPNYYDNGYNSGWSSSNNNNNNNNNGGWGANNNNNNNNNNGGWGAVNNNNNNNNNGGGGANNNNNNNNNNGGWGAVNNNNNNNNNNGGGANNNNNNNNNGRH